MKTNFTNNFVNLNHHQRRRAAASGRPTPTTALPISFELIIDPTCRGCGARLYSGTPVLATVEQTSAQEYTRRHACLHCAERASLKGQRITMGPDVGERPWLAMDRAWFAIHPGRRYRVRLTVEHELANARNAPLASIGQFPDTALCIVAYTGGSMVRIYLPFRDDDPSPIDFDEPTDDDIAGLIRDLPAEVRCALAVTEA